MSREGSEPIAITLCYNLRAKESLIYEKLQNSRQRGYIMAKLDEIDMKILSALNRDASLDELHKAVYDIIGKIPGVQHAEVFMEVARRTPVVNYRLQD